MLPTELWSHLNGEAFEELVAELFRYKGYNVKYTPTTGDQGLDLILTNSEEKIGVQCKRYSGNVGNHAVQEVYAGKTYYECDKAVVITTSCFTRAAIELANVLDVELIDSDKLAGVLIENPSLIENRLYKNPKLIELLVGTGGDLYLEQKYDEGIKLLSFLINIEDLSNDLDMLRLAFNNLGLCYNKKGKYRHAIITYSKALEIIKLPDFTISNNMAVAYRDSGELYKALKIWEELEPSNTSEEEHLERMKSELRKLIKENT